MNTSKKPRLYSNNLFIITCILVILGVVSVANVSAPDAIALRSDKFYFAKQHLMWAIGGIAAMIGTSLINPSYWKRIAVPFFLFAILLLVLVLVPGVGSQILGARRWIVFGGTSFQPSEVAKLALAIYLAKVATTKKSVLAYFLPVGVISGLIMLQPDLGTTMSVVAIGMSQILIAGVPLVYVGLASLTGAIAASTLILLSDYRRSRLMIFFEQTSDPLGEGYHIRQILIALASGGIFGIGLGQSRQKFLYLPEVCSDSVFAIIAEELGFVGALVILTLLGFYVFQGIRIVTNVNDTFERVLSAGLVAWVGVQIFLNVGSMVALIPLTGIPLPFFSCGGSSLVTILIATGILLSISKNAESKSKRR